MSDNHYGQPPSEIPPWERPDSSPQSNPPPPPQWDSVTPSQHWDPAATPPQWNAVPPVQHPPAAPPPQWNASTTQQQQWHPSVPQSQYNPYAQPVKSGEGFGVASLVLGIIALCVFVNPFVSIICGVLSLIFGLVGRSKRISTGRPVGVATAGIVCSIVALSLSVFLIILGIAAISTFSGLATDSLSRLF